VRHWPIHPPAEPSYFRDFLFPPPGIPANSNGVEIRTSEEQGANILQIEGEIDLHGSPALRAALHKFVAANTPTLLADFSAVRYIDSSGLATLIEYVRDSKPFGGKFALFGLQPKVKMVFELVRLNELFTIVDSKDAALAATAGS
jgi:anti-sigma B factor antagonist